MAASRTISYQALRSTYQPSSCYLATRNRHYSASAAAERSPEEAGPSSNASNAPIEASSPGQTPSSEQPARKAKSFRPISNKNRLAYERAKNNAEALRRSILQGDASKVTPDNATSGPVASSSALTPSKPKVEQSPTLETLESYRPERMPNPFGPRYRARYDKVWWAVSNAFVRKQLLKLAREIGFKGSNRATTKDSIVEYILRTWDWPPVAEVEAEIKAREEARKPVERVISLSHMEMFVLLRKSPRVLLDIADRQGMTITMSQAPELGLRAKGLAVHLGHLETVLGDMKKTIVHEYFSAEDVGKIQSRWLPAVAEMTGAFIEAMPNDMYKISSTGGRQAEAAKRLLRTAWIKNVHLAQKRPLISTTPRYTTPKPLAMYPFMPVPVTVLEWDAPSRPLFRVRTVGSWFADQKASVELGDVDVVKAKEEIAEKQLSELMAKPADGPPQATRRLHARFGHVLHSSPESAEPASLLTPPLQGQWRLDALRQWANGGTTIFTAGLPPSFSKASPPSLATATRSRRLLYREVGTDKFFALEVNYPRAQEPEPEPPKADWAAELDMLLEGLDEPAEPEPKPLKSSDLQVSCRYGMVSELDVMMPDRANDVRLAVEDAVDLDANSPPPQFEAFISELAAQNETQRLIVPPPTLNLQLHGKVSYELVEDNEVERVQQGSSMWWMSKRDILANGLEGAPELVIEQSAADPAALIKSIGEATSEAFGPPAATNWSMPGS